MMYNNMNSNFLFDSEWSRTSTKTDDEIKKLTLEEDLNEVKRALIILTKGQQLQKSAIYSNLHKILREANAGLLLPVIKEELQNQTEEMQIEAAHSLLKAIKVLNAEQVRDLLPLTFVFLRLLNPHVLNQWVLVLNAIVHATPFQPISDQVLDFINQYQDPYIAVRMIGFVADRTDVKGALLLRVRAQCSSQDEEVRCVLAGEVLPLICENIPNDLLQTYLFSHIMEMVYDSDTSVRKNAIQLFFKMQHKYTEEDRNKWVVKYFYDLLGSQNKEILKTISSILGQTYASIKDLIVQETQISQLLAIVKEYADSRYEEVRVNCAYNFVGLLILMEAGRYFESLSYTYIESILKDSCDEVRYILVASIHELIGLIGPLRSQMHLASTVKALMNDKDLELQRILIANIERILNGFLIVDAQEEVKQATKEHFDDFFDEILKMIDRFQKTNKWDHLTSVLSHLHKIMDLFIECDLFNKLMPILQTVVQSSCHQARQYACYSIAKIAYIINDGQRRMELIQMMNEGCLNSDMYQMRLNYIDFVVGMSMNCSSKFFLLNKFGKILQLADDRVLDVRLRLCKSLFVIRTMIDDQDEHSLNLHKQAVLRLLSQKKKVITEQIKLTEERIYKYNSNLNEEKRKHLDRDLNREQAETKRMAQELKNLIPVETNNYDSEPIPLSPFLLNFIKKQYKKRHSVIGTKVIATGAAANASLTQKISQNINKIKNQKREKDRESSSKKIPVDIPKPRRKSVIPQTQQQVIDTDHMDVKGQSKERKKAPEKASTAFKPKPGSKAYYSPEIVETEIRYQQQPQIKKIATQFKPSSKK